MAVGGWTEPALAASRFNSKQIGISLQFEGSDKSVLNRDQSRVRLKEGHVDSLALPENAIRWEAGMGP
jgi:hypothetical protein